MAIKQQEAQTSRQTEHFIPIRIVELELGQSPLPLISALDEQNEICYQRAHCLVRLHTQPLGVVEFQLEPGGLSAHEYLPIVWDTLGEAINAHLQQDGLPPISSLHPKGLPGSGTIPCLEAREQFLAHAPFVSVIVSTRDRTVCLAACLRSLLALHYPNYEIIVVDNAPATNTTARLMRELYADEPLINYICENRKGLSWARNCGVKAAKGSILAFTDDDVVVDPYWLVEMVRPFSLVEKVACVSGLILPLKLDTPAQTWFEAYGGFTRGFARTIYDMEEHHPGTPVYPYSAGSFGTGASMAFTASFLRRMGGFDTALGAGSLAKGGEDIAMFFLAIKRGYKLIYEPRSLLYHLHRQEYTELLKQVHSNGVGLTAYLTKNVLDDPLLLFDFVSRVPYGLFRLLSIRYAKTTTAQKKVASYPKALAAAELRGMPYGPLAYLRGRWKLRKFLKKPAR